MGAGWKARINGTGIMMFKFYRFKTLDSTNNKAKEFANKELYNLVVIAEKQTKGKGRFKRKWSSDLGGLYMTIVLRVKNIDKIKYLTFIAAISVARTINKLAKLNSKVKWPNDVLVDEKKICGILTETISGKENYALVGIGVNVNQQKFPKNIINKSISLFLRINKKFNIEKISKLIIKEFNNLYQYYKNENYKKILEIWKKNSHTLGKEVKAKTLSGTFAGKAVGVDKNCNLILRLKNGKIKKIIEGDIFYQKQRKS
ncbi:biotin--[acetyl-CoA-carboxylase] ligase [archaeon AH-315-M20]|nr:biotin--[acetyl-CoA-carboxylase] ligase [archaeon AH-315-M20]